MKDFTGKPAAKFKLKDIEGGSHNLSDSHGNWLLLVFHRHLG
jgi:peroxiredoxin